MAEKTSDPGHYQIPGEFIYDDVVYGVGNSRETLDKVKEFPFRQDDVLIVNYPKCGEYSYTSTFGMFSLHLNLR